MESREWRDDIVRYPEHTIFQTPAWLSFVGRTQNAEPVVAALTTGSDVLGYFTGLIVRKAGFAILGSPFPGWTTSYMGLCLSPEVSRRLAVEELTRFAFTELRCVHLELMDRQLAVPELDGLGFDHRILNTFEIDLTRTPDELFANMSSASRRCVRKAEKSGVVVEEASDPEFVDDYYGQLQDVFAKQRLVPTYGRERVSALIEHVHPSGRLLLLRARRSDGRCIATGIFPAMNGAMYFWGGASWRSDQGLRPNEAIQWYAMNHWKSRGMRVYDMGGGGEYKRKYGGSEIGVPWFRKSKHAPISGMRRLAQQVVRTRQTVLGKWSDRVGRDA
jgi:GNAT acetyltransferase-like protein